MPVGEFAQPLGTGRHRCERQQIGAALAVGGTRFIFAHHLKVAREL